MVNYDISGKARNGYDYRNDDAFARGRVYNATLVFAVLPGATVESVIEGALKYAISEMRREIELGLSIAGSYNNPMDRGFRGELKKFMRTLPMKEVLRVP